MTELTNAEELGVIFAIQDLIAHGEERNIGEHLEDDRVGESRFQHIVSESEIKKRETDRIPRKSRENTSWVLNCFRAWAEPRNKKIEMLQE